MNFRPYLGRTRTRMIVPILFVDIDSVALDERVGKGLLRYRRLMRTVALCERPDVAHGAELNMEPGLSRYFDLVIPCVHDPAAADPEFQTCFCRRPQIGAIAYAACALSVRHTDEVFCPNNSLVWAVLGDDDPWIQACRGVGLTFVGSQDELEDVAELHDTTEPSGLLDSLEQLNDGLKDLNRAVDERQARGH